MFINKNRITTKALKYVLFTRKERSYIHHLWFVVKVIFSLILVYFSMIKDYYDSIKFTRLCFFLHYLKYRKVLRVYGLKYRIPFPTIKDCVYVGYYENGKKKFETMVKNGDIEGRYIEYNKKGEIKVEMNYTDGKLNGKYERYFDNKKRIEYEFVDNIIVGTGFTYHANGNKQADMHFIDGKPSGKYVGYCENGGLQIDYNLFFDDEIGVQNYFYDNGRLYHSSNHKNGIKVNSTTEYYKNGKVGNNMYVNNNILTNISYYNNGNAMKEEVMVNPVNELNPSNSYKICQWNWLKPSTCKIYYRSSNKLLKFMYRKKDARLCYYNKNRYINYKSFAFFKKQYFSGCKSNGEDYDDFDDDENDKIMHIIHFMDNIIYDNDPNNYLDIDYLINNKEKNDENDENDENNENDENDKIMNIINFLHNFSLDENNDSNFANISDYDESEDNNNFDNIDLNNIDLNNNDDTSSDESDEENHHNIIFDLDYDLDLNDDNGEDNGIFDEYDYYKSNKYIQNMEFNKNDKKKRDDEIIDSNENVNVVRWFLCYGIGRNIKDFSLRYIDYEELNMDKIKTIFCDMDNSDKSKEEKKLERKLELKKRYPTILFYKNKLIIFF